jgi:hypothetical protein
MGRRSHGIIDRPSNRPGASCGARRRTGVPPEPKCAGLEGTDEGWRFRRSSAVVRVLGR